MTCLKSRASIPILFSCLAFRIIFLDLLGIKHSILQRSLLLNLYALSSGFLTVAGDENDQATSYWFWTVVLNYKQLLKSNL